MIKAILFDLDDTLIKSAETKFAALKYTGKKFYDMDLADKDIRKHWGLPFTVFMKRLFKKVEQVEKIIKNYYSVRESFPNSAYEDVLPTIKKLKEKVYLGIVSALNKKIAYGDMKVAGLNIADFFYIQTEEDTKIHKPDPRVFEPILNKMKTKNVKKNKLFFVGDHLYDFYAAKGAGIDFYGIADRTTSKEIFRKEGAKTITNLKELHQLIK